MKAARMSAFIVCLLWLSGVANAGITPISQTIDYTSNYNLFLFPENDPDRIVFLPPGGDLDTEPTPDHQPWYRVSNQDWGWTHDLSSRIPRDANGLPYATGIESATLEIEAWDVNADFDPPEIDEISANGTVLGNLDGTPIYDWGTTTFTLPQNVIDDLWLDGQIYIFINIDKILDMTGHRVTLGSSTLTVNYIVSGPGRPAVEPVFRFWSPVLSHHFYTTNESERDGLICNLPDTYIYEGEAYHTPASASDPNVLPVYRFWSSTLSSHFYTIDPNEKDYVINNYPIEVWEFEGAVFYAYPEGQQPDDAMPVYRFWSGTCGSHFYTFDEDEKNYIIASYPNFIWAYEGVAWYAYE
jgi:hypothetical protein